MKTVTVHVAKEQLSRVLVEARRGDLVVLTDGERQMTLEPTGSDSDMERDSPELAAELLKAAKGPFTPYSRQDLETIAEQVLRETSRE